MRSFQRCHRFLLCRAAVAALLALSAARVSQAFVVPSTPLLSSSSSSSRCSRFVAGSGSESLSCRRQQLKQQQSSKALLTMHMGQSHSHDHDHHHPNVQSNGGILWWKSTSRQQKIRRRRLVILVLLCALATLGPRLLWQRLPIRNTDVAAFLGSSLALASMDKVRREVRGLVQKFRSTLASVAKHSPSLQSYVIAPKMDAAMRVTLIGVVMNLFLSVGKLFVGIACHSSALIADAGHSLSDLFSDFVTLYTVQIARLPPDDDHPYGHGKFEAIGSLFLALTLLATGLSVGAMSNSSLLQIIANRNNPVVAAVALPRPPALVMAALSIFSKEWLFRVTRVVGLRLNSQVVLANAWHHRTDAYSSVLALVSIGLAMYVPGLLAADSFAGLLVAGMICMTGVDILGESIKQLSDTNNQELVTQVEKIVTSSHPDVQSVEQVRARQVGSQALVDVRVTVASSDTAAVVEEQIRHSILTDRTTGGAVMDAEVRATVAPVNGGAAPGTNRTSASTLALPRVSDVQDEVRERAMTIKGIASVEDVTVHFACPSSSSLASLATTNTQRNHNHDEDEDDKDCTNVVSPARVLVQVNIRVHKDQSLEQAQQHASELRLKLENSQGIDHARIFLDLNQHPTEDEDVDDDKFNNRASGSSYSSSSSSLGERISQ